MSPFAVSSWVVLISFGGLASAFPQEGLNRWPRDVPEHSQEQDHETAENDLDTKVLNVIKHFKQNDPVGLPGIPIPDPLPIPDMQHEFSVATMTFKEAAVHGLSKFRIDHVRSDLAAMQLSASLSIDSLEVLGRYTMRGWWSSSQGNFNVTLINVTVDGLAMLEVEMDGYLQAQDIKMNIKFEDITMNFENPGFMGNILQGIINSVGTFIFDSIKPFILTAVNKNLRGTINQELLRSPLQFPDSISPIDVAIARARHYVREQNYDPYLVPNYKHKLESSIGIELYQIRLEGLSTIYRYDNISVTFDNNVLQAEVHLGTQVLDGRCQWRAHMGFIPLRGNVEFTIEYLRVHVKMSQPANLEKRPKFDFLDIHLGNIAVSMDGVGTFDYIIEFLVNLVANLLRNQIMDAIEEPVKKTVQEILDKTDVEELILKSLNTEQTQTSND